MSSLWTPSGEHRPPADDPKSHASVDSDTEKAPTAEEVEALREVHTRLMATPVQDVVANHALGIWQLALVHLGVITPPDADKADADKAPSVPNLDAAGFAIDAMAALVDGLGERLGDHEQVLRDALSQAQMLFVEVSEAREPSP